MRRNRNQGRLGTTRHHRAVRVDFLSGPVYGRIALPDVVEKLVGSGVLFALVYGSQVWGSNHSVSDLDLAAYFGREVPLSCDACCRLVVTCRC